MRRLLLPALAALFSTGLTAAGLVALPASAGVPRIAVAVAAARPGDARLGDSVARHHDSDLVITVDFDAYPVGTEITNQYAGVTFEYPVAGGFSFGTPGDGVVSGAAVGPPPTVVASGGHSGAQAGGLFDGGGEFGAAGTFVALSNLADTVSVYIGDQVLTGVHVELDAYDADRHLLGSDTAVTSAVGAQTLLTYSTGGSGEIAYVAIYRSDIEDHGAVIDDLTVDEPPSTAPIVGVSTTAQSYELGQGGSEQVTLDVTRLDGASGPVMLAVSGVPSGVTASLSENPVTLPDTTSSLTLSASSSTAIGNAQVSLSASAGGALSQAATVITLAVVAPLTLVVPSSISVGACSANHVTVEADVAPGLSGPVSFSVSSSYPGLSASVSPGQVPLTVSSAGSTLSVSSSGGGSPSMVALTASLPSGASTTSDIPTERLGPQITSLDAIDQGTNGTFAGLDAATPRLGHAGTTIEVSGQYFCSSATVAVGNQDATVNVTVKHESGIQGPYDYLRFTTPRDATSGPVTVTTGSPSVSGTSTSALVIDSYRNTDAFNFHNFDPQLNFQDLTDAFGPQQTYINFNPCGILTIGLANCSTRLVPDPVAVAALLIAQAAMAAGTCFGFSLTDQRLLEGELAVGDYPGSGQTIYDLDGPKVDTDGVARGSEPLLLALKASHLMQLSTQFLESWAPRALAQSEGLVQPDAVPTEIEQTFAAGRYPMIELNDNGDGHVVVAYDLAATGGGSYDIYVYDSNEPFLASEDSNADAHAAAVEASVIHFGANGDWILHSTADTSNQPMHGGLGGIVVTDPATIPLHPTLATLGGIAPGLLFSSAGAPGTSGASLAGAARVTQVSGPDGKALYTSTGRLDTDPATRLDAVPFAPLVATGARIADAPSLTVLGPNTGELDVATTGTRQGGTVETLVNGGFVGSVGAPTRPGTAEHTSFSVASGTVGFAGASATPLSLVAERAAPSGWRSVTMTTSSAPGVTDDALALAPGGTVTVAHHGAPATVMFTLSGDQAGGLPATVTAGPLSLAAGGTALIGTVRWGDLADSSLTVSLGSRRFVLRTRVGGLHPVTITGLHVARAAHHAENVVLTARLAPLPAGSQVVVVLIVHRAHQVVARHEVVLVARRLVSSSWTVRLPHATGLTVTAEVVAIAVGSLAETSSVARRSVTVG